MLVITRRPPDAAQGLLYITARHIPTTAYIHVNVNNLYKKTVSVSESPVRLQAAPHFGFWLNAPNKLTATVVDDRGRPLPKIIPATLELR